MKLDPTGMPVKIIDSYQLSDEIKLALVEALHRRWLLFSTVHNVQSKIPIENLLTFQAMQEYRPYPLG